MTLRHLFGLLLVLSALPAVFASSPKQSFDIPAGDATVTLKAFARQSSQTVVYLFETVRNVRTVEVRGEFTPREALELMLAGSPLRIVEDEQTGALTVSRTANPPPVNEKIPETPPRVVAQEEVHQLDPYAVTVTVQKRPQSAQEVPIAMTSLAYHTLERFKVNSLRDLSRLAPNVLVSAFNQTSPTIAIRGATNTFTQIGVNKPVAVVIDDIFVPRNSAATFELFDLDSVQILRGPQGTLFGRNVTGGAIILNTRQPLLKEAAAAVSVEYGNYNTQRYQAMASVPFGDSAAATLTVASHTHDGYGRDRLTGREQDNLTSSNIRGQLLFKPTADLRILLRADYSDDENGGRTLSSRAAGNDGDRRTSELGVAQDYDRQIWGVSARADLKTAIGDFSSISAYRESRSGEIFSGTGAHYSLLPGGSQTVSRDLDHPGTFSQELRYASPRFAHGDFVAGLYYLNEDAHRNLHITAAAAGTGALVNNQVIDQKVQTESFAGYLDGTWRITEAFRFTLGARMTTERKEAALIRNNLNAPAASFAVSGLSQRWSEFTPRAVLAWVPNDRLNFYASATRGFTSGGYNTEAATAAIAARPFAPETVTNYELGAKAQLIDKRLRANVAVFQSKYADKQELYFNTATSVLTIVNASEAKMQGAEVELLITPTPSLAMTLAYGYLDASYDSFVVPGVLNYTGNPLGSSPRSRYSVGLDYQIPVRRLGTLSATASYAWTDDYYTGASKDPNLFVSAYSLVNANITFQTSNGRWRFSVWGKNLADTEYLLTPSTQGVLAEYLGDPRTYGVTLTWRY